MDQCADQCNQVNGRRGGTMIQVRDWECVRLKVQATVMVGRKEDTCRGKPTLVRAFKTCVSGKMRVLPIL